MHGQTQDAHDRHPSHTPAVPQPGDPLSALADRLLRVAQRASESARTLDQLSREQSAALSAGDIDSVLQVLERREPHVADLLTVHEELEPMVQAVLKSSSAINVRESQQREIRRVLAELDEMMSRIALRDAADQTTLQQQRTRLGQQLAGAMAGRDAFNAYANAGKAQDAVFQDRVV